VIDSLFLIFLFLSFFAEADVEPLQSSAKHVRGFRHFLLTIGSWLTHEAFRYAVKMAILAAIVSFFMIAPPTLALSNLAREWRIKV
jgi:ABC-type spermidine/putrescine transport system permease subunit I